MQIRIKKNVLVKLILILLAFNALFILFLISNPFKEQRIYMNKDGFSPDTVKVSQYTPVIFVNNDTSDRWPASNVHPTHDDYPEFDPQDPIKPGESWTFVPEKEGTWQFHDHIFPHKKGTIVVTRPTFIQQLFAKLKKDPEPQKTPSVFTKNDLNIQDKQKTTQLYSDIKKMAQDQGVEETWKYVIATYGKEDGTQGSIHDLAHFVGKLIFEEKGLSGISICTPVFAFGCFHGLLDTAFVKDLSKLSDAEKACATLGSTRSGPYNACVHGIGHGVASFYKSKDIKKALTSCEKMKSEAQYSCYDGVFMEFEREAPSDFYKKNEPLYPCTTLDKRYQYPCGRNQVSVMINRHKMLFNDIVKTCSSSSSQDIKNACYVALGFQTVYQAGGDIEKMKSFCLSPNNQDFATQCLSAAAGELMFQNTKDWQTNYPKLCNVLPDENKDDCFEYTDQIRKEYSL